MFVARLIVFGFFISSVSTSVSVVVADDSEPAHRVVPDSRYVVERLEHLGSRLTFDEQGRVANIELWIPSGSALRAIGLLKCPRSIVLHGKVTRKHIELLSQVATLEYVCCASADMEGVDLAPLRDLPTLRALVLPRRVRNEDIALIAGIKSLEYLDVSLMRITDEGVAYLKGHQRLKEIDGLNGLGITDNAIFCLQQIPCLDRVNLSSTAISDAGMEHLVKIKQLKIAFLEHVAITDRGCRELAKMRGLEELSLVGTLITDKGMREIAKLSQLKTLRLPEGLSDRSGRDLQFLPNLVNLDMSRTTMGDVSLEVVKEAKNLQSLQVGLETTDKGLSLINSMKRLESLGLANSQISDEGLRYLVNIPNLKHVNLANTRITGRGIEILRPVLGKLESLDLFGTDISKQQFEVLKAIMPNRCRGPVPHLSDWR